MRFVVARRIGRRGEGLGNEMLAWSKGFIASQVLGAKLIGPSWGLNKRKYYRNFQTSRFDFALEELFSRLSKYKFTEQDYVRSGQVDFGKAIDFWAREKELLEKSSYIVTVDGMYGGYSSIGAARAFLWAKLLNSKNALRNLYKVSSQLDPSKLFVAVHMRLGTPESDGPAGYTAMQVDEQIRGTFNRLIPLGWYTRICHALKDTFDDRIQFYFFADRGGPDFDGIVKLFNPGQVRESGLTECSDLALMAQADLRICSISSYSMVAGFLAQGPYIWYEPQLSYESGTYTLWGHEPSQRLPESVTAKALESIQRIAIGSDKQEVFQGYPVRDDGKIPPGLISQLYRKLGLKNPAMNLLEYGAVPDWVIEDRQINKTT